MGGCRLSSPVPRNTEGLVTSAGLRTWEAGLSEVPHWSLSPNGRLILRKLVTAICKLYYHDVL